MDGHNHEDVVEYREKVFLPLISNEVLDVVVLPELHEGQRRVLSIVAEEDLKYGWREWENQIASEDKWNVNHEQWLHMLLPLFLQWRNAKIFSTTVGEEKSYGMVY